MFNQLLQVTAAAVENGYHLFLIGGQRTGYFVCQQLGTLTHAGQRRLQLMRDMAQELMALRLQPRQTFTQPNNALSQRTQFTRPFERVGTAQRPTFPQAVDHSLYRFYRADNHPGE
ncbi:hypothetical protein D3C79_755250 [compost metagenome]